MADHFPLRSIIALACGAMVWASSVSAQDCPVLSPDLSPVLERLEGAPAVAVSHRVDENSLEPVARYTLDFGTGALVVVELQDCVIQNLRVTLLSPMEVPGEADLRLMAAALAATPVWQSNFAALDAAGLLTAEVTSANFASLRAEGSQFSYAMDDQLSSAAVNSEAIASFMSTDAFATQFASAFTLYIGVGGE